VHAAVGAPALPEGVARAGRASTCSPVGRICMMGPTDEVPNRWAPCIFRKRSIHASILEGRGGWRFQARST